MNAPAEALTAPARRFDADRLVVFGLAAAVVVPLVVFVVVPLFAILRLSFVSPEGAIGFSNYVREFSDEQFTKIVRNSLAVAATTTAITVVLAYAFAWALARTAMPFKRTCGAIALLPLYAPSLVQALGILFLLGRNGIINRSFDLGIDIYGFWGIVIADVFYSFPHAFLILSAALAIGDARLYESARMLGAGPLRMFRTITLPATRYGIVSAIFVVFTIVITDFGNPMVIGADYSVLATEIYNQVSGQGRMELGAVIGVVLLIPAAVAVVIERLVMRAHSAAITDRSQPLAIVASPARDRLALAFSAVICAAIASIVVIVVVASFVKLWPYNMSLSLRHYRFEVQNGIAPLWTSIVVSLMAAGIGAVVSVAAACVARWIRPIRAQTLSFLSMLPAAVPGMVLGLGYLLVFNHPDNPLEFLYGTLLILAICNVYHYHAQGYLIATTSVSQVSRVFDETSTCLGAGKLTTLRHVLLPIIAPTIAAIGVFFFVRSMVTLSAVIFLFTPSTQLAAVSVLLLDDSGNQNQAAAFSVCIMLIVAIALVVFRVLGRMAGRYAAARQQA